MAIGGSGWERALIEKMGRHKQKASDAMYEDWCTVVWCFVMLCYLKIEANVSEGVEQMTEVLQRHRGII